MATANDRQIASHEDFMKRPWTQYMPAFRIFGNLFFIGNTGGASHLVDTGEGLILFDTNYPTADALLIQSIWESGHDPREIKLIFHTHCHFDHIGATSLLTALSGAKTCIGMRDTEHGLLDDKAVYMQHVRYAYLEKFVPDFLLKDGDTVSLGNTTVRAVATPGHTAGAMTYVFGVTDGTETLTAALHGGAGLFALRKDVLEPDDRMGLRAEFERTFPRLAREHVDIFLGNHTAQSKVAEKFKQMTQNPAGRNPFIDPNAWNEYLAELQDRYNRMVEAGL